VTVPVLSVHERENVCISKLEHVILGVVVVVVVVVEVVVVIGEVVVVVVVGVGVVWVIKGI